MTARLIKSKRSTSRAGKGWKADLSRWKELAKVGIRENLKWKKVNFLENRKDSIPERDAGIYLICAGPPRVSLSEEPPCEVLASLKLYNVLYAGKTTRGLRARFLEHIKRPPRMLAEYRKCYDSMHFCYAVIGEPEVIKEMEFLLIDSFGPPCNSIRSPGADVIEAHFGATETIGPSTARVR